MKIKYQDSNAKNYRKARLFLNTPAEVLIFNAIQEVEKLGGSEQLTKAVTLLSEARDIVGDYIDKLIEEKPEFTLDEYKNQDKNFKYDKET